MTKREKDLAQLLYNYSDLKDRDTADQMIKDVIGQFAIVELDQLEHHLSNQTNQSNEK